MEGEAVREESRRREQQEREKEEANKKKKEDSTQKDYYPPSPVYDPSFKEAALPLFDSLIPAPGKEGKQKEEEEKELDPVIDYYPQAPYTILVMRRTP